MTKQVDPLILECYRRGIEIAKVHGGDYMQHAYEHYVYSRTAYALIMETIKENNLDYSALTMEKKCEINAEVLNVLAKRGRIMAEAKRLKVI